MQNYDSKPKRAKAAIWPGTTNEKKEPIDSGLDNIRAAAADFGIACKIDDSNEALVLIGDNGKQAVLKGQVCVLSDSFYGGMSEEVFYETYIEFTGE
jgi:hypothetical protein